MADRIISEASSEPSPAGSSSSETADNGLNFDLEDIRKVIHMFSETGTDWQTDLARAAGVPARLITRAKLEAKGIGKNKDDWRKLYETLNNPAKVRIDKVKNQAFLTEKENLHPKKSKKHPFFFYPTTSSDWNALQAVSWPETMNVKLIRSLAFEDIQAELAQKEEEKIVPVKDPIRYNESEKKLFFGALDNLNKLSKISEPKQWTILHGENSYKMLIVVTRTSKSSNYLHDLLTEIIEREFIDGLLALFELKMEEESKQGQVSKNNRRKRAKTDHEQNGVNLEEIDEVEKQRREEFSVSCEKKRAKPVFPSQKIIAEQGFKSFEDKLVASSTNSEPFKSMNDFKFIWLVPDRVSLEKQSRDRLLLAVRHYQPEGILSKKDLKRVVRVNNQLKPKWDTFMKSVRDNPSILHMVLHDEAHWGAGKGQLVYKLLGFETGDYHLDERGQTRSNLITLLVTATPYNLFTTDVLQQGDILDWQKHMRTLSPVENDNSAVYQGLTKLRESGKIVSGTMQEAIIKEHFKVPLLNGFPTAFIEVMLDYLMAISVYAASDDTSSNRDQADMIVAKVEREIKYKANDTVNLIVSRCIQERKTVILRLSSARDGIKQSEIAKKILMAARTTLGLEYEVLENAGDNAKVDSGSFHKKHRETLVFNAKQQQSLGNDEDSPDDKQYFSDVMGIPLFMIIVEKGRMGDTFPDTCVAFDLRARYGYDDFNFTPVIQDVGRTFGYGDRPLLLLSEKANQFLLRVWKDDRINYGDLESSDVVGGNMKRRGELDAKDKDKDNNTGDDEDEGEDSESSDILALMRQNFEEDPTNPTFLFGLQKDAFAHRIILKAEPQIGKTGAFLHLLYLFADRLRDATKERKFSQLEKDTDHYYNKNSLDNLKVSMHTEEGKQRSRHNIGLLRFAREKRFEKGILEPAKWAALMVTDYALNNKGINPVVVADIGCGDHQFTKFLREAVADKLEELVDRRFVVHGYDISPNYHDVNLSSDGVEVIYTPGYTCDKVNFYDCVVNTLAQYGNGKSWKETPAVALRALKIGGGFFMVEFKNHLPGDTKDVLQDGVEVLRGGLKRPQQLSMGEMLTFIKEFNAIGGIKISDCEMDCLISSLPERKEDSDLN